MQLLCFKGHSENSQRDNSNFICISHLNMIAEQAATLVLLFRIRKDDRIAPPRLQLPNDREKDLIIKIHSARSQLLAKVCVSIRDASYSTPSCGASNKTLQATLSGKYFNAYGRHYAGTTQQSGSKATKKCESSPFLQMCHRAENELKASSPLRFENRECEKISHT